MDDASGPVVVFSGGGTGGHLYPALALAEALRVVRPDVRLLFVGAERGLEARVLPERGYDHILLPLRGIDRRAPWTAVGALLGVAGALGTLGRVFLGLRPELVVVTGGYAAAPAGVVAGMMGIPLLLQEQNSVPGVTARWLSRLADEVFLGLPGSERHLPARAARRARLTGNPVRDPLSVNREEARAALGLPQAGRVVLVTGGSQGSRALNRGVLEAVALAVGEGMRLGGDAVLLWSTGPTNLDAVTAELDRLGNPEWVHARGYIEEMPMALAAADLAISRSGAMTTSELLVSRVPAILVPLPTAAADHQTLNARALVDEGAATLLPETELTGERLRAALDALAADPAALGAMRDAAARISSPGATRRIAEAIAQRLPSRRSA